MERCVFCGWSRRTALANVSFFQIPREPGLKKFLWTRAIGSRPITSKDRVCSVHFRAGRPSSDASHEDFVPHLYLNRLRPGEMPESQEDEGTANARVILEAHMADMNGESEGGATESSPTEKNGVSHEGQPPMSRERMHRSLLNMIRGPRPNILQRRRRPNRAGQIPVLPADATAGMELTSDTTAEHAADFGTHHPDQTAAERYRSMMVLDENGVEVLMRMLPLSKAIVDAAGVQPGQTVILRHKVPIEHHQYDHHHQYSLDHHFDEHHHHAEFLDRTSSSPSRQRQSPRTALDE